MSRGPQDLQGAAKVVVMAEYYHLGACNGRYSFGIHMLEAITDTLPKTRPTRADGRIKSIPFPILFLSQKPPV